MMRLPLHYARSAGVGLVTAIFLLVVLSGLGVAMVSLYTTQQASSNLDIDGARAYQAARAGMEYGLFQRRRTPVGSATNCPGPASPTILRMPANSSLAGFTVVVTCIPATGVARAPANIRSDACNMADEQGLCEGAFNNPQYVKRTMEVEA